MLLVELTCTCKPYLPTYFSVCAGQPSEFCRIYIKFAGQNYIISQRDRRAAVVRSVDWRAKGRGSGSPD